MSPASLETRALLQQLGAGQPGVDTGTFYPSGKLLNLQLSWKRGLCSFEMNFQMIGFFGKVWGFFLDVEEIM